MPYSNVNGLIPNNAILTNVANVPLFARNLYNKVVNGNVTVSTVEIPNTVLNYNLGSMYEISKQFLYSETNQELIANDLEIDKNVYETVDINFYNTITMKDSNDINNEVMNINGAIRINESVSKYIDYHDSQATKVRINYSDGTSYSVAIDPSTQISKVNNKMIYSFLIYAPTGKDITDLEIISYDEKTSYAKIKGTFTQGKYYQITQNVRVE